MGFVQEAFKKNCKLIANDKWTKAFQVYTRSESSTENLELVAHKKLFIVEE